MLLALLKLYDLSEMSNRIIDIGSWIDNTKPFSKYIQKKHVKTPLIILDVVLQHFLTTLCSEVLGFPSCPYLIFK